MTDTPLLPCPFCGGEARFDTEQCDFYRRSALVTGFVSNIECLKCDAKSKVGRGIKVEVAEKRAAVAWNRRA